MGHTDCVILVDLSNLFIEGQRASAFRHQIANGLDPQWRVDFSGLRSTLAAGRNVRTAILAGSAGPSGDLWSKPAIRAGFTAIVCHRTFGKGEKGVDTSLAIEGAVLIALGPPSTLVIASGDEDFLPLVERAKKCSWNVELAAFGKSMAAVMAAAADKTRNLDGCLDLIGYRVQPAAKLAA